MDIREKFLQLTSYTYPHPDERGVLKYLPEELVRDNYGNYYLIIEGDDTTMFTSHLDTADSVQKKVKHVFYTDDNGDEFVRTDGTSILGADDKSGVTIMLYMISKAIPGIYYFFVGEECGMVGSGKLKREIMGNSFRNLPHLENVNKCVSFDRRYYNSIITRQLGKTSCSDDFADYLISEYDKNNMNMVKDDRGIYTDSAAFIDIFDNCTNISVGYSNEHTASEKQNLTFLEKIAKASCNVNWSGY